jgi:hypothetical protein
MKYTFAILAVFVCTAMQVNAVPVVGGATGMSFTMFEP